MTPCRVSCLFVLALLALAPAYPTEDIDDLVRASNAAFHDGDLAQASALLEQAQRLAPDPRLVAFNLATIRYHQARAGQMAALAEAEVLYRCCIEPGDVRRAEALLGLGTCLLTRGSSGHLDALALRAAIDRFTLCRREPGCPPDVARAASWNEGRARLLLLQAPPPAGPSSEDPPADEKDPDGQTPSRAKLPADGSGEVGPDQTAKGDDKAKSRPTEEPAKRSKPGKGSLTPLADQGEAPPIAESDAGAHLDDAVERISTDWLRHKRRRSRAVSPGGRDW
jgi:hypothetical protein